MVSPTMPSKCSSANYHQEDKNRCDSSPTPKNSDSNSYQRILLSVPTSTLTLTLTAEDKNSLMQNNSINYNYNVEGDESTVCAEMRSLDMAQSIELRQVARDNNDSLNIMNQYLYLHLRVGKAKQHSPNEINAFDEEQRDQRKFKLDPSEELYYLGCEQRLRRDGENERHYFQRIQVVKKYKNGRPSHTLPDCKEGCNCYRRRADIPAGQFEVLRWNWSGPFRVVSCGRVRREAQPSGKATKPCDTDVACLSMNGHFIWAELAFLSSDRITPLRTLGSCIANDMNELNQNSSSPCESVSSNSQRNTLSPSSMPPIAKKRKRITISKTVKPNFIENETEEDSQSTSRRKKLDEQTEMTQALTEPIQTCELNQEIEVKNEASNFTYPQFVPNPFSSPRPEVLLLSNGMSNFGYFANSPAIIDQDINLQFPQQDQQDLLMDENISISKQDSNLNTNFQDYDFGSTIGLQTPFVVKPNPWTENEIVKTDFLNSSGGFFTKNFVIV